MILAVTPSCDDCGCIMIENEWSVCWSCPKCGSMKQYEPVEDSDQ